MKLPICELDAKSGVLCEKCKKKLEEGKITELDVKVSQIIYELNKMYNIEDASFEHAIDIGKVIVILTKGEVGILIGKKGRIIKELARRLGKAVRIVHYDKDTDINTFVAELVGADSFVSTNKIYKATGDVEYRAVIKKVHYKTEQDAKALSALLSKVMGTTVHVQLV